MPPSKDDSGPQSEPGRGPQRARVTRRQAIAGAAILGVGVGVGVDRVVEEASSGTGGAGKSAGGGVRSPSSAAALQSGSVAFYGQHQAGIATPAPAYLHFAAFDLGPGVTRAKLQALLRRWSAAAAALAAGRPYPGTGDPGEAVDLPAAQLTLTFGFGPSMFVSEAGDRFGLASRRPNALEPLPAFAGEALDPQQSDGDLCAQACANDPQVAFHAIHVLALAAGEDATLRWSQVGFRPGAGELPGDETRRNLLGFKDGTHNIRPEDPGALKQFVWVQRGDGPAWMTGGTFLVARRIQIVFSAWDGLPLGQQERTIGRHKLTGAPLGGRREYDPVDLAARAAGGQPVIPLDAHIRLASPESNKGERILRRGYSYSRGSTPGAIDAGGHELDGGLFFVAFVRDPGRQFIPLQRRLATGDALSAFTLHTATAVFACPPGARRGGFVGERLFA